MPQINQVQTTIPGVNRQQIPLDVQARLAAAEALQNSAAQPIQGMRHPGAGFAQIGVGALGGLLEGQQLRQEQAAQAANREEIVKALLAKQGSMGGSAPGAGGGSAPSASSGGTGSASPSAPSGPIASSDRDLAIRTIAGEAGGESDTGQAAVASVIKNRMASGNYGGPTLAGVITAPKQFSVWNPGDPAGAMANRLDPNSPQYQKIGAIFDQVMAGKINDPTNGADHYYNPNVANPAWGDALGARNSIVIGNHRFVGGNGPVAAAPAAAPGAPPPTAAAPPPVAPSKSAMGDMPAPDAQAAGSSTLPPGVTPPMVSAPPGGGSVRDDVIAAIQAQKQQTSMAPKLPGSIPQDAGGLVKPQQAVPGFADSAYLTSPNPINTNAPGAVAGGLGARQAQPSIPGANAPVPPEMAPTPDAGDDPSLRETIKAAMQQQQAPLQPVPGPSGPDDPANGTDYALSPSGPRSDFAPSVQIGGMPAPDANEGPAPVVPDASMLSPQMQADPGNAPDPSIRDTIMAAQQMSNPQPDNAPLPPPRPADIDAAPAPANGPGAPAAPAGVSGGGPAPAPLASGAGAPAAFAPAPQMAPSQAAIANALANPPGPQAAPSPMAGGLAPPGHSPMSDPSSALNFDLQQGGAQGAPPPAALASALSGPGPSPAPSGAPPMAAGPAPAPSGPAPAPSAPGPFAGLGALFGGGQQPNSQQAVQQRAMDLAGGNPQKAAIYAAALDPRTPPELMEQLLQPQAPIVGHPGDVYLGRGADGSIKPIYSVPQLPSWDVDKNGAPYNKNGPVPPFQPGNMPGGATPPVGAGQGGAGGQAGAPSMRPMTPQERQQAGIADGTPAFVRPDGSVEVGSPQAGPQGETAEAKTAGEQAGTRRGDMLAAADAAPDKIARLNLLGSVLQQTKTGPLAEEAGNAGVIASRLGVSPERLQSLGIDPNQAVNNQIAGKLAGEMTMGSIGAKNGGMPASNFSVAERQFIEKLYPSIENQPGSNAAVVDVLKAVEQKKLDMADAFSDYKAQQRQSGKGISYEDFEDQWRQQHGQDNIFAPIVQKYQQGGYTPQVPGPGGASVPAGAPGAPPGPQGAGQPQPSQPSQQQQQPIALPADPKAAMAAWGNIPRGSRYTDPQGNVRVKQ